MEPLPLHAHHASLAARFGALNGREVVLGYADPAAEYRAARSDAAVFDRSSREVLRLTGPDRVSFLHGMVTNDVKGLADNAACDAAFLTVKGGMVADARVVKLPDALLLDLEPGLLEKVRAFLDRYLISEDVELTDVTSEWGQLSVLGPNAERVVSQALATSALPDTQNGVALHQRGGATSILLGQHRLSGRGVELLVPRGQLAQSFEALRASGATPAGFETMEIVRVEAGVPRYGQDLIDTTIPLEAELSHAISYNKGCYIGQEVIARATFRGHMNRKLTGLLLGPAIVAPLTELRVGEKKIGWVTSVVDSPAHAQRIALGYVHRDHLAPGTVLAIAGSELSATVQPLPLVPPMER